MPPHLNHCFCRQESLKSKYLSHFYQTTQWKSWAYYSSNISVSEGTLNYPESAENSVASLHKEWRWQICSAVSCDMWPHELKSKYYTLLLHCCFMFHLLVQRCDMDLEMSASQQIPTKSTRIKLWVIESFQLSPRWFVVHTQY